MANYKPNKIVKWDSKNQAFIATYVDKCLSVWNINDAGEVSTSQISISNIYEKILANNIQLENVDEIYARQRLIRRAIIDLKKKDNQNIQSFKRLLASKVYKFNNRLTENYFIFFLFQVSSSDPPQSKQFSIHGFTFHFRNWNYFKRNFDYENFSQETTLLGNYLRDLIH
ncbi:MAG: hypothetical protein PVJ21_12240 [Anaerolineales bacterium]|jgi:hypothetical protein